ncbi:MAG: A-macroglobulin complement component [Planctomycetes bacterium]|nr:A-macroglobulin complement component [Planctomycetota bacterium]
MRSVPLRRALVGVTLGLLVGTTAAPLLGQGQGGDDAPRDDRWQVHLAADRPTYRPGETVRVRGPALQAFTRRPLTSTTPCLVEVKSPRGEVVTSTLATIEQGALSFVWTVPAGAAGGRYTVLARTAGGDPAGEVGLEVLAYRVPRLRSDLQLARKGYGPGEVVEALLHVTRAEGGPAAGARVTAIARVDGQEAARADLRLDAEGKALVSLPLPRTIATPEASLACVIQDGGVQETAARTIPLLLAAALKVELCAESGDLVAGLPGRVYLEARTLTGDPADLRGRVVDDQGATAAQVATEHEGRGRFELVPAPGRRYRLIVEEPRGVSETFPLPDVRRAGWTLSTPDDVLAPGAPARASVAATEEEPGRLAAFVHDREVASAEVTVGPAGRLVALPLPAWAAGVVRLTLFDGQGRPRAERLVLRRPQEGLRLEVTTTPAAATPRARVKVTVRATGPDGRPVDAWVAVSAVDDAALSRIDVRDRAPRLPVQALLGPEVRELKDAHVYLDDPARGPRAADLLLGAQAWRRFAWLQPDAFVRAHGDAGWRALARRDPEAAKKVQALLERQELRFGRPMAAPAGGDGRLRGAPPPAPAGGPLDDVDALGAAPVQDVAPVEAAGRQVAEEAGAREALMDEADDARFAGRARRAPAAPPPPQHPRLYQHRAGQGAARADFAETLLWSAGGFTGARGELSLEFDLCDSITTFRIVADGVGRDGALAWGQAEVTSRRPLYVEAKLPLEVTAGDRPLVPVVVVNGAATPQGVVVTVKAGEGLTAGQPAVALALGAEERRRALVPLTVGALRGDAALTLEATGPGGRDVVSRTVKVVPRGFPFEHAWGGQLVPGGAITRAVTIPEGFSPMSLEAEAVVHATPLATLQEALAALLREPMGCFEQTSSSHYPNVMAMRYMTSHHGVDPALVVRTRGLLDRGYQKLVSFECKEKGYEWFGGDPGHEALTAYGLLEFTDMKAVHPVDDGMLARTRAWLLARRDGKGGFLRNQRALDSFGRAPADVTDAYIAWALVEAGEPDVTREVEAVLTRARASDDAYVVALAANIALARGEAAQARDLLNKLAGKQAQDGGVDGAATSITGSGGTSLRIETTALAALAFLRSPDHTAPLERAMTFILESCQGGRFGSTQATVLALRAILAYDAVRAAPRADGTVLLLVDGEVVDEVRVGKEAAGAVRLPRLADALGPGRHEVTLRMVGGGPLPASVVIRYRTETPPSAPGCALTLSTALDRAEVAEGEVAEVRVRVASTSDQGLPMAVAIVGLPGGLEVRTERLEELRRAGAFDMVETRGREVILYWRSLAPRAVKEVTLQAVAAVPGRYTGPASRAYLYYTDEEKRWTAPLQVTIAPR